MYYRGMVHIKEPLLLIGMRIHEVVAAGFLVITDCPVPNTSLEISSHCRGTNS